MGHIPREACSLEWDWRRDQNLGFGGRETEVEGNREQTSQKIRGGRLKSASLGPPGKLGWLGKNLPKNTQVS